MKKSKPKKPKSSKWPCPHTEVAEEIHDVFESGILTSSTIEEVCDVCNVVVRAYPNPNPSYDP